MPTEHRFDDLDLREEPAAFAKLNGEMDTGRTQNTCNLSCFNASCIETCLC